MENGRSRYNSLQFIHKDLHCHDLFPELESSIQPLLYNTGKELINMNKKQYDVIKNYQLLLQTFIFKKNLSLYLKSQAQQINGRGKH